MANSNGSDDQKRKFEEIGNNLSGDIPQKMEWRYTEDGLANLILTDIKDFIPEFEQVTIEVDQNSGAIMAYAWLPINCKHLMDSGLKNDNDAVFKIDMPSESQQLKNFANRFCPSGRNRAIPEDTGDSRVQPKRCAIMISVQKILEVHFDKDGKNFREKFGYMPPACELSAFPELKSKNGKETRLDSIIITKQVKRYRDRSRPVPKKSFKSKR